MKLPSNYKNRNTENDVLKPITVKRNLKVQSEPKLFTLKNALYFAN